jgi:hypothetical protein
VESLAWISGNSLTAKFDNDTKGKILNAKAPTPHPAKLAL